MNKEYYSIYTIAGFVFMIAQSNHFIVYIGAEKSLANYQCQETTLIKKTKKELEEYFLGIRKEFDIPIKLTGTEFQNRVWREMQKNFVWRSSYLSRISRKMWK